MDKESSAATENEAAESNPTTIPAMNRGIVALFLPAWVESGRESTTVSGRGGTPDALTDPEGAASRGRLIPFGRWPGVSAGTRRPERTALAGSTYGDGFPRRHR